MNTASVLTPRVRVESRKEAPQRLDVGAARPLSLAIRDGVHPVDPYAGQFAASMRLGADDRVLDVGCGAGAYGLAAAARGASSVLVTDTDPAAVACALENARRNGLEHKIAGRVGSLFGPVARERFSVIVTTLPQLPAPRPVIATRYGGADGLDLLREAAAEARDHLVPGGKLYALVTGWAGPGRVAELFEARGFSVRVAAKTARAFQPVEYDRHSPGLFEYLDAHVRERRTNAYSRRGAWCYLHVSFLEATAGHQRRRRNSSG
jgi:SAM-dependent methyltransferase